MKHYVKHSTYLKAHHRHTSAKTVSFHYFIIGAALALILALAGMKGDRRQTSDGKSPVVSHPTTSINTF